MNVFGKRERGWRKKRKRGVSPIIATILLVAITVVLAAVLYVLITGLTTGGANSVPIGGTLGTSAAVQSSNGNCPTTTAGNCYSAQVGTSGSAATTANIRFAVSLSGTPLSGFTVVLADSSGNAVATYTQGAATPWVASGTLTLPQSFAVGDYLYLSDSTGMSGYSFQALGVNGLNGAYTISAALP